MHSVDRRTPPWLSVALGVAAATLVAVGILLVGPPSPSATTQSRMVTVQQGIVQSTVSGSGNLQAASQLNLGFKTSGTVSHIYVTQGQQVAQGQLLATLDPQSAEVALEQSKAALQAAEASLAKAEETGSESASGQTSGSSGTTRTAPASAASVRSAAAPSIAITAAAPAAPTDASSGAPAATTKPRGTAPTTTSPSRPTPTTTTTTSTPPPTTTRGKSTTSTQTQSTETKSSSSSSSSTVRVTREANIASAEAAVKSAKLTVQSNEQAVQNTKLYAPESGTIASLTGQVGETVSGGGTTKASTSGASSGGSASGGAAASGASGSGARSSSAGSSSASGSASTGSSSFAVLSDLSSMVLVVPLSESEVGNVKAGQIATVTIEALSGRKVAAHVSEVAILSTSNSGVVSYNVTFQLDQMEAGMKPGMSATAEVVVKQAEGINVPTSAITASTVTVVRAGKQVRQRVATGLAGNSSTIILSGLKAGETVVLPSAATTSTTGNSTRRGLGGLGGGLGGGLPSGGAFFRGGG
jgi:macrolide-specific efflux system membrane fusion protein